MGTFSDQLRALADKAKVDIGTVVRKTVADLQGGVVLRSPVDTGRFRANWMVGIGTMSRTTVTTEDKTGAASVARVEPAMATWTPGAAIFLTNSLPYAKRLEYDAWSKQAPGGMVRLTVQDWREYVRKAIAEVQ